MQDKAQGYVSELDRELSKYPTITNLEKQTGVPKVYAVLGVGALYFIFIFFNLGAPFLSNLIGFVYPAYESLRAIESTGTHDDTQWLTYWVVFAAFNVVEYFSGLITYWFPFYFLFKTAFIVWLALPQFKGAQYLYSAAIRPLFIRFYRQSSTVPSTSSTGFASTGGVGSTGPAAHGAGTTGVGIAGPGATGYSTGAAKPHVA